MSDRTELDADELRLLRTYSDGKPRIWDAADLFRIVVRLNTKGMIAPAHGAYVITEAGKAYLTR